MVEPGLDQNLYSRQIGAYGTEMMGKLIKMKVLISGLRGVGVETAKNLILAGPAQVQIHDPNLVQINDLASNFYCSESDVGKKTRAEASFEQLKELNSYVSVSILKTDIDENVLKNFDVVVILDYYDKAKLIQWSNFCHSQPKPIGFIYAGNMGLYGFCFVDFGKDFKCFDKLGEDNKSAIVSSITKAQNGIVTCHEDKRHGFSDDDYVTFHEVQGMAEINEKVFQIKVLSPHSFQIGDTSAFSEYSREGIVEQTKVPVLLNFKSFEDSLLAPFAPGKGELDLCDWEKFGYPEQLHYILNGILNFSQENKGQLPQLNSEEDAQKVIKIVEQGIADNKNNNKEGVLKLDEVNEKMIKNCCLFARAQISPQASFWGGIVAQEIVKHTGKFTPLSQWLHYEVFEALPEEAEGKSINRKTTGCRYDDNIAIFGQEIQDQLINVNTFLVGAGALGCEYVKMFALLGIACGPKGKLQVTDDDNIEVSNLNRQFLFRKENVGSSKAAVATQIVRKMNPDLKSIVHNVRVSPENDQIFNDDFWENLDFVVNAVDNVKARLFIDSRCVFYGKPLFESGTLGTKCNSQVVIPKETQSYGDSQDPPEEQIPLCTLKNFPHLIDHCIQWARDYFEGEFIEGPSETSKFIQNPQQYVADNNKNLKEKVTMLRNRFESVYKFANLYNNVTIEKCVELARIMFDDIFHNMIKQLLYSFPHDHKTESGSLFWSGPKRPPTAISFDANDPAQLDFVFAAANIFMNINGLPYCKEIEKVKQIALSIKTPEFKPKKASVKVNDNDTTEEKVEDDEQVIEQLTKILSEFKITGKTKMNPTEFEKDDDSNYHIDFVTAVSNLRARNYKIKEVPRIKVKLIAGKIIPAIATATAMIVGACGMEIIKQVQKKDISKFKNSFMNLALPLWLFSEPLPPIQNKDKEYDPILLGPVKAIPSNFTCWDSITIPGPKTLQEFIDYFRTTFNIELALVSCGKCCIFNMYSSDKNIETKKKSLIQDTYTKISGQSFPSWKKYLELEVSGEYIPDSIDTIMPTIRYSLK